MSATCDNGGGDSQTEATNIRATSTRSPVISVITCTRNSAQYLGQCVRSVQEQSYPHVEHIFVDGNSTDETLNIISSTRGIVRLVTGECRGIGSAMNRGITEATGGIVAHLHSDDYYADSGVLARVAEVLRQTRAGWLFGRCLSDIDGHLVPENHPIPRYSYRRLLKGNFIPHPATFVRRQLLEDVGAFDPAIRYAMDYDLWLRLGRVAIPVQLDDHLAVFRCHPGSLTSANRVESLRDDFSVRMRYMSRTPWSLAYHWSHYLARQIRLRKQLARTIK